MGSLCSCSRVHRFVDLFSKCTAVAAGRRTAGGLVCGSKPKHDAPIQRVACFRERPSLYLLTKSSSGHWPPLPAGLTAFQVVARPVNPSLPDVMVYGEGLADGPNRQVRCESHLFALPPASQPGW
jgi:hypothetical protein